MTAKTPDAAPVGVARIHELTIRLERLARLIVVGALLVCALAVLLFVHVQTHG